MMKKIILLSLLFSWSGLIYGQVDIKVMSYNLLTFPEAGGIDRVDTLKKILNYYQPDLFLIQELKSEDGLTDIVAMMNNSFDTEFESGTYVPQISNPSNDWRLQQNLIFNEARFKLETEETIVTDYRDINYYKLEILDLEGSTANDPYLHVYVCLLYTSPSPRDLSTSRMPSSA